MVLAVAHSIHIVTGVLLNMGRGMDRRAAIADSLRLNASPVFLTSVTTMIGFLSLNSSDSPPVQIMGTLSAFGMLSIYLYSMTLLPALLSILPLRSRLVRSGESPFFERFGQFVVERRSLLLWSGLMVSLALVAGIPRNEFSDDWTKQFDERYQFRRDTDFVSKNLTGLNALEYSLVSGIEGGNHRSAVSAKGGSVCRMGQETARGGSRPGVHGHHETPEPEHARRRSGLAPLARKLRARRAVPAPLRAVDPLRRRPERPYRHRQVGHTHDCDGHRYFGPGKCALSTRARKPGSMPTLPASPARHRA